MNMDFTTLLQQSNYKETLVSYIEGFKHTTSQIALFDNKKLDIDLSSRWRSTEGK
jgi:hypothetical protein